METKRSAIVSTLIFKLCISYENEDPIGLIDASPETTVCPFRVKIPNVLARRCTKDDIGRIG